MNVEKRISKLENIVDATDWKGRIVGIKNDDSFNVVATDQQGNRQEFKLSVAEFQQLTENSERQILIVQ